MSIKSIKFKQGFSALNFLIVVVLMAVLTIVQFVYMDDIFMLATKITMINLTEEITEMDFKSADYDNRLSDIEAGHSVYIEIYHPTDKLIYTTDSNQSVYEGGAPEKDLKPRIMRILTQKIYDDGSYFETRQEFFATAQYLVYGKFYTEDYRIEIYSNTDVIKEAATTASWTLFVLSVLIIIAIFAILSLVVKFYIDPIQKIKSTTQKMAKLEFDEICPHFKNKELDELSDNINFLSSSLSKSLKELKNENRQLESDIEKERRIAKSRRSFVANASHELKTPISIIQGYAEGMKYGIGCDSTEEFCDIIIEESEKMNNLIVRLMEQLQYSSNMYELIEHPFNIRDLITELIDSRRLNFKECGIKLTVEIPEEYMGFGDKDLLSTVFNNYFSNALSHLGLPNELKVSCRENEKSYRLSVYNSGKQVSGTDIENIWQSFYRADKAHSRKEGRFGLGLSIVATIQDLHKQQYGVINREHGVEFWFDVKKEL